MCACLLACFCLFVCQFVIAKLPQQLKACWTQSSNMVSGLVFQGLEVLRVTGSVLGLCRKMAQGAECGLVRVIQVLQIHL